MAKTRKPNQDDEEKIIKEYIQKRFETMFSGKGKPLSNMSIQEVETLKTRVAELETQLTQSHPVVVKNETTAQQADSISLSSKPVEMKNDDAEIRAPEQKARRSKRNVWQWLVEPPAVIKDVSERRQASLVSTLLLILILAISSGPFAQMFVLHDPVSALILAGMGIGFIIAYISSRTNRYHLAIPFLLAALAVWPLLNILLIKDYSPAGLLTTFVFDVLIILISSTFASFRTTIFLSVANFLGILLVPLLIPGVPFGNIVAPLSFNGVVSALMLIFTRHRNLMEEGRLTEVATINSALQTSNATLNARTDELNLAVKVAHAISRVRNLDTLLTEAVNLIRDRYNLYYVQVYLTDPTGRTLFLRAGTGEVGAELLRRGHTLLVGSGSINGRAAGGRQAVTVADTRLSTDFRPNPLLPDTRSEMSIPLIVNEQLVGVLDMQSTVAGALTESNLTAFEVLAGQLAVAVQNAVLFTRVEEARTEVEAQVRHITEKGWQDFLDAIERGHKLGYAFDQTNIIRLKPEALSTIPSDNSLIVPVTVTGTKIGEIRLPVEQDRTWTSNELELIKATSAQLAQHIENLRLLAQAEQYRFEAEQVSRRLTHEGWNTFLGNWDQASAGYRYDLNKVEPFSGNGHHPSENTLKQLLVVREEPIGELTVEEARSSEEATEIIAAVAAQLSGHIENLRLSELNERRAQREQTLRQITNSLRSSNNPTSIMQTAVRELGSIMRRKAVVQLVDPQRTNQAESAVSNEKQSDSPAL